MVAYCARVSNPNNQHNVETSEKLVKYLLKNKHWSPFEMVSICLEINTTRDIARQLLRHRSFAFQEFSQRYAQPTDMIPIIREARLQDHKNRQNSIDIDDDTLQREWIAKQEDVWKVCEGAYSWARENGLAKEVSRCVLPEGLTPTRLYMHGNLRSWIHFLQVRCDVSTQKEHRDIAQKCANQIVSVFPNLFDIIKDE
tara:strand:- start:80 stop:673 length:594 start_codon:yes stop_codon:yes gene_type:complete